MRAKFEVEGCCGDHVAFVEIEVSDDHKDWEGWELQSEYGREALDAAGIVNFQCEGCYDSAYRAKFVEWADEVWLAELAEPAGRDEPAESDGWGTVIEWGNEDA